MHITLKSRRPESPKPNRKGTIMTATPIQPSSVRESSTVEMKGIAMNTNRNPFAVVCLALLALALVPVHAAIDWKDAGTDWGTGTNWVGDTEPGSSDTANFPAAATIANQPTVGATGDRNPQGITIDNSQADYNINGTGVLSLGSDGLTVTGGGTTTISAPITLTAAQIWDIGTADVVMNGRFTQSAGTSDFTKRGSGKLTISGPAGSGSGSPDIIVEAGTLDYDVNFANERPYLYAKTGGTINMLNTGSALFGGVLAPGGDVVFHVVSRDWYNGLGASSGGTLTFNSGSFAKVWGPLSLNNGHTVLNGTGEVEAFYLNVTGAANTSTISGSGTLKIGYIEASNGTAAVDVDITAPIQTRTAGAAFYISGAGSAAVRLAADNTYTGVTTIRRGVIIAAHENAFGNATSTINIGFSSNHDPMPEIYLEGPLTLSRSFRIEDTDAGDSANPLLGGRTAHTAEFSGNITLARFRSQVTAAPLRVSAVVGGTTIFSGNIVEDGWAHGLTKEGAGTVVLAGSNSYTGTTTISAGTLQIGNGGATGNLGSAGVVNNAALSFNRNDSTTVANNISGSGSLTQNGAGILTLAGTNTYNGASTVNAGVMQFAVPSALYNGNSANWTKSRLTANDGGTLAFSVGGAGEFTAANVTTLLTNLTGDVTSGGFKAGSAIGLDTSNAAGGSFTLVDNLADTTGTGGGALGLVKLGSGTLVLSGSNSHTGQTVVRAGTLLVNGTHNGGGNYAVRNGATLGGGTWVNPAIVTGNTVIIEAGGTLAPGSSPGEMQFDNLTIDGSYALDIGDFVDGDYDRVLVSDTLTLGAGSQLVASKWANSWDRDAWYPVLQYGTLVGQFASLAGIRGIDYGTINQGWISIQVPEPTSLALLTLGGLALLKRRARRA